MINTLQILCDIAKEAGDAILDIYHDEEMFKQVDWKEDNSPITLADLEANNLIESRLRISFPQIPILSEEGNNLDYKIRKGWSSFFLVDPLDGTKEFINRNGEFTVNIALISDKTPELGIVHAPALNKTYLGSLEEGAFRQSKEGIERIRVNSKKSNRVAVRSKSHSSPEEESVLNKYEVTECMSVGSSLKFCLVSEGTADLYYRHGPTMEWDIAAGHAVVKAAGGHIFQKTGPKHFQFNKESLLNDSFLCLSDIMR